jgi:hypothetical protein
MTPFYLRVGNEKIELDKSVFVNLLDSSHIKESKPYLNAVELDEISFTNLKKLAVRAGVPYPLFFAPKDVADFQIEYKNKNLFQKIPSKAIIALSTRGRGDLTDIAPIILDLSRKQDFLKKRILIKADANNYLGSLKRMVKDGETVEQIAAKIRDYFGFNLTLIRALPKTSVLAHITRQIEQHGLLVSFSAYNYMPQNINPELLISGICVGDKKFPYLFI